MDNHIIAAYDSWVKRVNHILSWETVPCSVIQTLIKCLFAIERPHDLSINTSKPHNISKRIGDSVYLKCEASGAPIPKVTWLNEIGEEVGEGDGVAVLHLNNITKQNHGSYTCNATNSEGWQQYSVFLHVLKLMTISQQGT